MALFLVHVLSTSCIVCVLEGDPTARQPAGSLILFVLEVEIQDFYPLSLRCCHFGLFCRFFRANVSCFSGFLLGSRIAQ
jgi:hypothetical protein